MAGANDQERYVATVLAAYRRTPGTLGTVRPADRRLAADLHDRGVPLAVVEAALSLAAARRTTQPDGTPPLDPIRSLHYFLPVITELLERPPDPAYLAYLERTLASRHKPDQTPRLPSA